MVRQVVILCALDSYFKQNNLILVLMHEYKPVYKCDVSYSFIYPSSRDGTVSYSYGFYSFVLGKWSRRVMISAVRQPSKLPVQVGTNNQLSGESVIKELIGLILLYVALFVCIVFARTFGTHWSRDCWAQWVVLSVRRGCPAILTVRWYIEIIHASNIHLGSCLLKRRRESWGTITALLFPQILLCVERVAAVVTQCFSSVRVYLH